MEGSPGSSFILILILVLVNAFFASAEMAIVSLNKTKINILAEEGNKKAKLLKNVMKDPNRFLSTIQVGITFAGFFASASAATSISYGFANFLKSINVPYSESIALLLTTLAISYITLVLGELVPKRIALQNSEKLAMSVIKPIIFISKLTKPFVWFLSFSTNIILKIFRINTEGIEEQISREEIRSLIEIGEENGAINPSEREMIDGIIEFDDTTAKKIMTPRTETFLLNVNDSIRECIKEILDENYSRIPVYEGEQDNIIGILHMKDLFACIVENGIDNVNIRDLLIEPSFFIETKNIDELFKELKEKKAYIAILIDEYGGFSGIVTMEDIIEEVMGEILDEYDDNLDIEKIDDDNYIVSGLMALADINSYLDIELESEFADTIAGLFIEKLGEIPTSTQNCEVVVNNVTLKLLKLDDKRIDKIHIVLNHNFQEEVVCDEDYDII
ncbi:HlyC/CorC family transporter [Clostridium sp. Sa3CUN1]|uniref:HlyC/CorC family transporter n=1 Tax=Clostridium gallinarum TaxID=2762246 RepID=A0ABR8PZZ3_9CLOT|nr:hemolysin family protein [Clostridium gallinarum]MBD7913742.1 HlyC/CorC family transporter [Clostridium gallinarum]